MATSSTNLSLKLMVDKKANRVLFAEAGKDFVDFLFNLLSLPIGTVIKLLNKGSMVGCIGNLSESLENLSEAYIQPNQNKDSLLNPRMSNHAPKVSLLFPGTGLEPTKSEFSFGSSSSHHTFIVKNASPDSSKGGYVKGLVTYMVTDDLSVSTISMISSVALFNKFNVKDFAVLEERVVEFGINEGVELLKASLQSNEVPTRVFLGKKEVKDDATSSQRDAYLSDP